MHEIEEFDLTYSTEGTEWHGLANHVENIGETEINSLCFDIVQGTPSIVAPDGSVITVDGHKLLLADVRHREDIKGHKGWLPLHVPKDSYEVISNRDIYEMAKTAFQSLGCKLVTAGTLGNLKKFYLSVDIGNKDFQTSNGDKFASFLDFISSHDGTFALECYDSLIRIVCMNTFRWSRDTASEIGVKFYHTKNVSKQMEKLPEYLTAVIKNREKLVEFLNYLLSMPIDATQAAYIAASYLNNENKELSTTAFNRSNEIRDLSVNGSGQKGCNTLYDLWNGFTEYFTHSDGAGGKKASKSKRMSAAKFGQAAEHKDAFLNLLLDSVAVETALATGEELYRNKNQILSSK